MPWKDKERKRIYQREWLRKRRQAYLTDKYCVRCYTTDITKLQIDHIDPRKKLGDIKWSWCKYLRDTELSKCQVLCDKCHSMKTNAEANLGVWWPYGYDKVVADSKAQYDNFVPVILAEFNFEENPRQMVLWSAME